MAYISYKKLRYTLDKSVGKFDRRVLFSCAHVPGSNFFGFFETFFLIEGDIGLCGFRQFFLGCFGNFNFKLRYCSILRTCGIRCFIVLDGILIKNSSPGLYTYFEPFLISDRKMVSYFLLIISQHAIGCYLFCLSGLNQKL